MDWQPIETAPRDGTDVLLFLPKLQTGVWVGRFVDSEDFQYGKSVRKRQYWSIGVSLTFLSGDDAKPTHWMPIPEGPVL